MTIVMEPVTDIRFKKIQLNIKKLTPQDGDVLVITLPPETDAMAAQEFAEGLKKEMLQDVQVTIIITRDNTEVDLISEHQLNQLGYYRTVH